MSKYQGRDYYYYKDGEAKEEFKSFYHRERYINPPKWKPVANVADPYSCKGCYGNMTSYGMNYLPSRENYQESGCTGGCYSGPQNYGENFRKNYEQNWRCATPNGCKKQISKAAEGVI